eukprot:gene24574-biopygen5944
MQTVCRVAQLCLQGGHLGMSRPDLLPPRRENPARCGLNKSRTGRFATNSREEQPGRGIKHCHSEFYTSRQKRIGRAEIGAAFELLASVVNGAAQCDAQTTYQFRLGSTHLDSTGGGGWPLEMDLQKTVCIADRLQGVAETRCKPQGLPHVLSPTSLLGSTAQQGSWAEQMGQAPWFAPGHGGGLHLVAGRFAPGH